MAGRDESRVAAKRKYTELGHEVLIDEIQTTEKRIGTLQSEVEAMKKHALTLAVTDSQLGTLYEIWEEMCTEWQDNMVLYERDAIQHSKPSFTEITVWFGYDGTSDRLALATKHTFSTHRLMIGDIGVLLREVAPESLAFMRIHNVQIHAREATYTLDTSRGEPRYSRVITEDTVVDP